jgi:ubiquinone/menaquinone biosynthesis C-methylase UbiE
MYDRNALRARALRPWSAPTGLLGRLAGWEMTTGKRTLNAEVCTVVDPQPRERILEVGFGPGVTLRALLTAQPGAHYVAVDPSVVMLTQARRRNAAAITAGRLTLELGHAESLRVASASIDKALTLNSLAHWSQPSRGLAELGRVLRPGGLLVVRARGRPGAAALGALTSLLRAAGFQTSTSSTGTTGLIVAIHDQHPDRGAERRSARAGRESTI